MVHVFKSIHGGGFYLEETPAKLSREGDIKVPTSLLHYAPGKNVPLRKLSPIFRFFVSLRGQGLEGIHEELANTPYATEHFTKRPYCTVPMDEHGYLHIPLPFLRVAGLLEFAKEKWQPVQYAGRFSHFAITTPDERTPEEKSEIEQRARKALPGLKNPVLH